jgi:hypothetical protein
MNPLFIIPGLWLLSWVAYDIYDNQLKVYKGDKQLMWTAHTKTVKILFWFLIYLLALPIGLVKRVDYWLVHRNKKEVQYDIAHK